MVTTVVAPILNRNGKRTGFDPFYAEVLWREVARRGPRIEEGWVKTWREYTFQYVDKKPSRTRYASMPALPKEIVKDPYGKAGDIDEFQVAHRLRLGRWPSEKEMQIFSIHMLMGFRSTHKKEHRAWPSDQEIGRFKRDFLTGRNAKPVPEPAMG